MIDLVYILGRGNRWNKDNDLRYSLRSVDKYLSGYNRIIVIGEKPDWLTRVIHIPGRDAYSSMNKEANIISKTLQVLNSGVSQDFIHMNDDYFFCKDFDIKQIPINGWYKGKLQDAIIDGRLSSYKAAQHRTMIWLRQNGYDSFNYDGHSPVIFNQTQLRIRMRLVDWQKKQYVFRSLYFNMGGTQGEYLEDLKVNTNMNIEEVKNKIAERNFFSTSDRAMNSLFKLYMEQSYSKKSKFEK